MIRYNWKPINTFFDNESATSDDAAKAAEAAAVAAATKAASEAAAKNGRTYTEEEFQKALVAERQRAEEFNRKLAADLEQYKKNNNLTAAEKDRLQKQIDELNSQYLTQDQLYKQEKDKLISTYESQIQATNNDRDTWKNRYVNSSIERAIKDAAVKHEAHDAEVFLALLGPKTQVVEDKDENGNSKGFKVRVKLTDVDKDGKEIQLDLDPNQAVKQLKDKPDNYGYLFKGHTTPGVGGNGSQTAKPADYATMSITDYAKIRVKG